MAFVRGEEGSVKFKNAAGTTAAVASTTGWSLDMTKDILECTAHGDTARKYVGSLRSGTGTVDLLYTATSGDETQEFIKDILTTEDPGDAQFESFNAAIGDIETISVSFTINGALTSDGY
jgi:hypothetical protein